MDAMKTKQTPEVIATSNELDRVVALSPTKSYNLCNAEEKKRYDDVESALKKHRAAVREARGQPQKATRPTAAQAHHMNARILGNFFGSL